MAEEIEKIYIIPLKKISFKSSKAAPTAVKRVKKYLTKHMKVEQDKIWMDDSLNNALWSHGKYNMPSKIRVKAVKFDDGVVEASLPELEFKKSRRELLKEEKEKKTPILRREEEMPEGEEGVGGAEDYDIAPTGEGEVKIKKKKAPKEKEDKKEKIEKKEKPKTAKKKSEKEKTIEKKSDKKTAKKTFKEKEPKKKKTKTEKQKASKTEKKSSTKKSKNKTDLKSKKKK
jgi:large subunit ribosomal protein L31e